LGNIAGDSPICRDLVLGHKALHPLLNQLRDNSKLSMLRNATWTLSNFCRGKPQPDFEEVFPFPLETQLWHRSQIINVASLGASHRGMTKVTRVLSIRGDAASLNAWCRH
jgi:hypothetical protein